MLEVHSLAVKRWHYIALAAIASAGGIYLYMYGGGQALMNLIAGNSANAGAAASSSRLQWHTVERADDGFKVDLPADDKDLQVPAFNETGGAEPVKMVVANPNDDVTYAVTWEDNPPVARVNHSIDRILNMARDGMLARTMTTIISESRGYHRSSPCLDVLARNAAGGILNARLIVVDQRLYVLMALFPSPDSRNERDVKRFFNSLVPSHPSARPEGVPPASQE
jgi:hypothetical protein